MNYRKRAYALTATVALAALPVVAQETTAKEDTVEMQAFVVSELADFADQAVLGSTPVAFTEFDKAKITGELGSRDIPLVLNSAPSIYASEDSGGAGDARVNLRGFSQRNIAILINGVPTNDMENGWLYWSNWDGLGDVSQSIQLQRGLSNTSLPLPSIGGTMNIITDPSASIKGGSVKFEVGSDSFTKATAVFNTGLVADKFALTVAAVAKKGDGTFDHAWTKGQGYYIGAAFFLNDNNRIELYGISAPQQHSQRFDSNIAVFDAALAKSKFGYTDAQVAAAIRSGPVDAGYGFNPNSAPVSSTYTGKQWYLGGEHDRYDANYMDERVNYYTKPQVNLNWFSTISDSVKLATVLYYSGGEGGGSGTYGSTRRYASTSPYSGNIDWDAMITRNQTRAPDSNGEIQAYGALRNSTNYQDTYGAVSKLTFDVNDDLSIMTGVDWRTATIEHFREIRDLLGADYYYETTNQFTPGEGAKKRLGDKVNYWNTNTVDWLGLFVTGKYTHDAISAFATYGYSSIGYSYTDNFRKDTNGNPKYTDSGDIGGNQIKGGLRYAFTEQLSGFVNAGWVSKAPIFDGAIDDTTGQLVPDPTNEKFKSVEFGGRWENASKSFNISANAYFTKWEDRTEASVNETADIVTYQRGINSEYSGVELETAYQASKWIRFDGAASFGNWTYTNDVDYTQYTISTGAEIPNTGKLYIKDLKVGDQPQTQITYAVTVFPTKGLSVKLQGRWYDKFYADYDALTRNDSTDRGQAWQIPSYQVYDLHISYDLPQEVGPFEINLFAHVFNLLDKTYISDASDNSSFEGLTAAQAPSHSAQRASVFFGKPMTYNMGIKFRF